MKWGEIACGSFTINTAAGRGLCTGRLEPPEKMQPERAGWLCSPNHKINITQTIMTKTFFFKKGHKNLSPVSLWLIIFGKTCVSVTRAVEAAKNRQFLPASRNVFYTVQCILNKLCRTCGGAIEEYFDREF